MGVHSGKTGEKEESIQWCGRTPDGTRERDYRKKEGKNKAAGMMYRRYPAFVAGINAANGRFNEMADELEREEREGNVFLIAPSQKVEVSRFDGDMEKLGDLYWLGYHDTEDALPALMDYLEER